MAGKVDMAQVRTLVDGTVPGMIVQAFEQIGSMKPGELHRQFQLQSILWLPKTVSSGKLSMTVTMGCSVTTTHT